MKKITELLEAGNVELSIRLRRAWFADEVSGDTREAEVAHENEIQDLTA